METYYKLLRKKLRDGIADRQTILSSAEKESLKRFISDERLIENLIEAAKQSYEKWCHKAEGLTKDIPKRGTLLRRLESFSKEWQSINERMDKNLKKLTDESKRLRTILSTAELGAMYDMTAFVDMEIDCNRIWGVLKDIRFGKREDKKFLPGNVELVFALSAGMREISINIAHTAQRSNYSKLVEIIENETKKDFDADQWDREIAKYNNRIVERKIITGNILGAYCHPAVKEINPRFITFTLAPDEKGQKCSMHGLLLPMNDSKFNEALGAISLPLTEGVRYATSNSFSYTITGMSVRFSLMPVRNDDDDGVSFRISVEDNRSKAFAEPEYDEIRGWFKSETITSTLPERKKSKSNLNNRKQRKRFFTDMLEFDSQAMQNILQFLAVRKATIVVPRQHITLKEMKLMKSESQTDENKAWPLLDWQNEAAQPLPPSQQDVLLRITPPVIQGRRAGREVRFLSPFVLLCRETMKVQGGSMADNGTRLKVKKLYFDWKEGSSQLWSIDKDEKENARKLRCIIMNELHELLVGNSKNIQLECYDRLQQAASSEHLDEIDEIIERFNHEFLFMTPPKETIKEFLDGCPCSDSLIYIIEALQKYLNGETDIIIN